MCCDLSWYEQVCRKREVLSKPRDVSMLHLPPTRFLAEHIETENVCREGCKKGKMTIDEMKEACQPPSIFNI